MHRTPPDGPELDESRPIFIQIAEQVENDIIDGTLPEGSQIPSTNEFAAFLRVNPATALALRNHFEAMWQDAMRAYAKHVIHEETRDERSRDKRRKPRR